MLSCLSPHLLFAPFLIRLFISVYISHYIRKLLMANNVCQGLIAKFPFLKLLLLLVPIEFDLYRYQDWPPIRGQFVFLLHPCDPSFLEVTSCVDARLTHTDDWSIAP